MKIDSLTAAPLNTAVPPAIAFRSVCISLPSRHTLRRALRHRWDLFLVLTLLGSSALAGVSLLFHMAS